MLVSCLPTESTRHGEKGMSPTSKTMLGGRSACKQRVIVQPYEWSKRGRGMPGEEVSVCGRRGKVMLELPVEGGAAFYEAF